MGNGRKYREGQEADIAIKGGEGRGGRCHANTNKHRDHPPWANSSIEKMVKGRGGEG